MEASCAWLPIAAWLILFLIMLAVKDFHVVDALVNPASITIGVLALAAAAALQAQQKREEE